MSSVKTIAQFRQLRERALWKLLASHNAPIVLAVLQELLLGEHKVVPASALHERLTQELLALKQAGEDMTQSAQVYVAAWLSEGWLTRVAVPGQIAKAGVDLRVKRIAQIHDNGASGGVVIGEQKTAFGHPVLGVMHLLSFDAGGARRLQLTVVRRGRIAINHSNEVFTFPGRIARPCEQVVPFSSSRQRKGSRAASEKRGRERGRCKMTHQTPPIFVCRLHRTRTSGAGVRARAKLGLGSGGSNSQHLESMCLGG